ncbi:MAG: GntP family permease [Eubacteriaceae bacterium]
MLEIVVVLGLLMVMAYFGMSILWIAPLCAVLLAALQGLPILPTYLETYMSGLVGFAMAWFPIFMLGAIFGKVIEEIGAAKAIANLVITKLGQKFAVLSIVLSCGILAYGGVSMFVLIFAIYPMALELFKKVDIPRRLIPGTLALGSFTFAMTAIPGTPQIQNLIPMKYFGTTAMAAPTLGIIAALIMGIGGYFWIIYRVKRLKASGFGFGDFEFNTDNQEEKKEINPFLACIPLSLVIICLNVFEWHVVVALLVGILSGIGIGFKNIKGSIIKCVNSGANNSLAAIMNTSAAVGFGAVVKAVPAFSMITDRVLDIGGNPLISEAVAVNLLAGATGSASGGLGIALEALGAKYVQLSEMTGISLETFHRIASVGSGGLDTLPHNGAVLTLLALCGLSHKESYFDIFMVALVIPTLATIAIVILGSFGIC